MSFEIYDITNRLFRKFAPQGYKSKYIVKLINTYFEHLEGYVLSIDENATLEQLNEKYDLLKQMNEPMLVNRNKKGQI